MVNAAAAARRKERRSRSYRDKRASIERASRQDLAERSRRAVNERAVDPSAAAVDNAPELDLGKMVQQGAAAGLSYHRRMRRQHCAVCDCGKSCEFVLVGLSGDGESETKRMLEKLNQSPSLPEHLREYYTCPHRGVYAWVGSVMLSPFETAYAKENRAVSAKCCAQCWKEVRKGALPKFAINNGLYMATSEGAPMDGLSAQELNVLALYPPSWSVQSVYACPGKRSKIMGHSVCRVGDFEGMNEAVAHIPSIAHGTMHVHLSGPMTSYDVARLKKPFEVRRGHARRACNWLKTCNALYASVGVDDDALTDLLPAGALPGTVRDCTTSVAGEDPAGAQPLSEVVAGSPLRASVLTVGDDDRTEEERLEDVGFGPGVQKVHYKLGKMVADHKRGTVPGRFPGLFPYGRGGPAETRAKAIGERAYLKHVLMLSHGRFGADQRFCLEMFDGLQRANSVSACLRAKVSRPELAAQLTFDEIQTAVQARLEAIQQYKRGAAPASGGGAALVSDASRNLLLTVDAGQRVSHGTTHEAPGLRAKVFALRRLYGGSTLWVT